MRKIDILIFLSFALTASWQDIRYRGVTVRLLAVFAAIALFSGLAGGGLPECFYGALAGFAVLLISHLTRGAIGSGDGWFFVVSGLMLPLSYNFLMLITAVFLCGIFSLVVFVARRQKTGRYAGKDTLPFIPFAAAAGVFIVIGGLQ